MITATILILIVIGLLGWAFSKTFLAPKEFKAMMTTPKSTGIIKSNFFDNMYVGMMTKLDPTLKYMVQNAMFEFPSTSLTVKSFNNFDITSNPFELITFDLIDGKQYVLVHDEVENTNYFLQELMTIDTSRTTSEITYDNIPLEENGEKYEYTDFSGLIQIKWRDHNNSYLSDKLIRMYLREITPDNEEYLMLLEDSNHKLTFYVGFVVTKSQLENV
jgi:hypothetical protein